MNLCEILQQHAQSQPEAIAIIDTWLGRSRLTTFAQLNAAVRRAATLLEQQGLRPGDAVLVFHPMSAELYTALLALFQLRLVAMFLDPSAGREHLEQCCALHRPKALIASTKAHLLRLQSPALRQIPVKFVIGFPVPGAVRWSRAAAMPPHQEIANCPPDAPALLTFTSGSTGRPKAAVRTHGFLLAQHRVLEQSLRLNAGEVDLTTLPIVLLANLASGVTSLIPAADLRYPGAINPVPVIEQILTHRPVSSAASPAFFECLTRYCTDHSLSLPSLKKLFSGGAPVFPRLLDHMQAMAPNADVVAVYGSTEAEPIAHISRREIGLAELQAMHQGRGLLAGPPVDAIQLRILRDQWGHPVGPYTEATFATDSLAAGQPGEIVVSGKHVLQGYLHGRGDEETKFRVDGVVWHRTGDAGYVDGRGWVWLLGRCAARISDRHGILYPFAAETAVSQDVRVRRAAMVAHAQRRILAIEFYDPATTPDLTPIREALSWTHCDEVRLCKRIPVDKRHNAKIDYPSLYRMLEKEH
jgi:olefin beta-lactone synthetase